MYVFMCENKDDDDMASWVAILCLREIAHKVERVLLFKTGSRRKYLRRMHLMKEYGL